MARKTIKNRTIDTTFSKLIRERDDYICQVASCPHCGNHSLRNGGAECSHYRGRRYLAGRWHPDNCITLCHFAHRDIDQGPQALHVKLMIEVLGETRHDALVERLQKTFRYPQHERIDMHNHYKAQLRYLERRRNEGEEGVLPVVSWD
jgi:hypothetical protein